MIESKTNLKLMDNDDLIWSVITKSNNIPILEENFIAKMDGKNGFSKSREFQHIGRIPLVAYLKAEQDGYNLDDEAEVMRFFRDNPEFLTSNPWVKKDSNNHKIIIK